MPLLDQSGKRTSTVIREELGQHAIESSAVDLRRHDDHARLSHDFSIRGASVALHLRMTHSSFRDPVHERFFSGSTHSFNLECVNDFAGYAVSYSITME